MSDESPSHAAAPPRTFLVRVLRQDGPGQRSYWQQFRVEHEPDMNCISVLQEDRRAAGDCRRPAGGAGRLGVQLPGRGLRGLHDARERRGARRRVRGWLIGCSAGKRGQVQFAGTARRVLRTNWTCPLFPPRTSSFGR